MNNSSINNSKNVKAEEKGIVDSAADLAKDARNMVSDIVDITKETITEKAQQSKLQKPEDKGVAGLAAEFAKNVGDLVSDAVEGTKEIVSDAIEGTKEIASTHYPVVNSTTTPSDAALDQQGDNVEITITKVTVKGLANDKHGVNQSSGNPADELVQDARAMINNAVESGATPGSAHASAAPSVTDSAKEFAKNVRDVITDAFQNTKESAAEKGLGDSASKLASDVKTTVSNVVGTAKEKVTHAADVIADQLVDTPPHGMYIFRKSVDFR
uniref:Uncharacterized protein n=1 Tax=Panagrolaimus sp. ES5 TaxID=591445 RepID=A0AC34GRZ1_9BILA